MKESVPYFNTRDLLSEVLESAIGLKQYLFMINIQVYNYYNTWLKAFDNKIENLIYKSSPYNNHIIYNVWCRQDDIETLFEPSIISSM